MGVDSIPGVLESNVLGQSDSLMSCSCVSGLMNITEGFRAIHQCYSDPSVFKNSVPGLKVLAINEHRG